MAKKQAYILLFIVLAPIGVLTWLGVRLARDEQTVVRQQLQDLLRAQLLDTDAVFQRFFDEHQRTFFALTADEPLDSARLRRLVRENPHVRQVFVLMPDGRIHHPPPNGPINDSERGFLERARVFLSDKDLVRAANRLDDTRRSPPRGKAANNPPGPQAGNATSQIEGSPSSGWHVWFWGRGVNLVLWRRLESRYIIGLELDRSRWMADLIAGLPNSSIDGSATRSGIQLVDSSRIQLVDSNDHAVYQWGGWEPPSPTQPVAELPLSAPLSSWRLKYYVDEQHIAALSGRSTWFNHYVWMAILALGISGLGIYLYRESARELREAATRVSFVNQVSHELKTPLTNIRMYAELLESDLQSLPPEESVGLKKRLGVIVAESGRLSRLIGNVLSFARDQRQQTRLNYRAGVVDDVVRAVIEQFMPTLDERKIAVESSLDAAAVVRFDPDAVEQILVNLISNVEKYAAGGKLLRIATRQTADHTSIDVSDNGQGIARAERERVFQPFYRTEDRLEDPTGAGIGLSIVRSLARLHGGDITIADSETGASFEIVLKTAAEIDPD